MKLLIILGLALGSVGVFAAETVRPHDLKSSTIPQKTKRLELSIITDQQKYKRHSKIRLTVMVTNQDYVKDVFVYRRLEWGYLSSLTFTIRDASGKLIHPTVLPDDLPLPIPRDDTTNFVRLNPQHFLGTYLFTGLDDLNLRRPGKYTILVEYHCPISNTEVDLSDFGKKAGSGLRFCDSVVSAILTIGSC